MLVIYTMSDVTSIVNVKNLKVVYNKKKIALDGISIHVDKGETLGVIGESGSGKTTLGLSILRLIKITEGEIHFKGLNITNWNEKQLRKIRKFMQLVPQDPYSSMNPKLKIRDIVVEPILNEKNGLDEKVNKVLQQVGLDPSIKDRYPRELSGGQRQRVLIARAMIGDPEFIVLDEPTSNLDVSIQAQILNLLLDMQEQRNLSYLFITHNIQVAKYMSNRIAVLYGGKLVELGETKEVIKDPLHPYTMELLDSIPSSEFKVKLKQGYNYVEGENKVIMRGCVYFNRCKFAKQICKDVKPELRQIKANHFVACHLYS